MNNLTITQGDLVYFTWGRNPVKARVVKINPEEGTATVQPVQPLPRGLSPDERGLFLDELVPTMRRI